MTVDFGSLAPLGLPRSVQYCTRCVISNQKPVSSSESLHKINDVKVTTSFTNGVCDACLWAEAKETVIDWDSREQELSDLCDSHRKSNGEYDVIVPVSGGKDSRYVAHLLKERYRMNPLTVTWRPHIFTPIGLHNYFSLIDSGQANILYSPRGDVQRKLTQLAFQNLGHPFQPFIAGQRVVGPLTALKYDIKLVFYGENVAEYGNNKDDNYSPIMKPELYTCFDFSAENLSDYFLGGVPLSDLVALHGLSLSDLQPYRSPSLDEIKSKNIQVHYMSYYRKWVPQENYYYAVKHTGFLPNERRMDGSFSKYAGIDDSLEDLHFYMQLIKFGMGRATWDAAQEVRSGKLERDEAVALVNKYGLEEPRICFDQILEYLGLTVDQFRLTVDKFRTPHLWTKTMGGFVLTYPLV